MKTIEESLNNANESLAALADTLQAQHNATPYSEVGAAYERERLRMLVQIVHNTKLALTLATEEEEMRLAAFYYNEIVDVLEQFTE